MPDELIDYIKKEREKGFSDKDIKDNLLKAGYSEDRLKAVFDNGDEHPTSEDKTEKEEADEVKETSKDSVKVKKSIKSLKIVLAVIILMALGLGLYYIYTTQYANQDATTSGPEKETQQTEQAHAEQEQMENNIPKIPEPGCDYVMKTKSRTCRALISGDASICDSIGAEDNKRECIMLAKFYNSEDVCADLELSGEDCSSTLEVANRIRQGDTSVCDLNPTELVYDEDYKKICLGFINEENPCVEWYDHRCP